MAGGVLVSLIGAGSALYVARMQRRRDEVDDDEPANPNYRSAATLYPNSPATQPATAPSSQPAEDVSSAGGSGSAGSTVIASAPAEPRPTDAR
jgi:hypothetical protein